MRFPLKLLKKEIFQLKLTLVEQKNHVSFGWTLKLCILFMVITSKNALACWGWGGVYDEKDLAEAAVYTKNRTNFPPIDEKQFINLTGITDPMERIIKTAWSGFVPDPEIQKDWHKWHDDYFTCKALYEGTKRKKKKSHKEKEPPLTPPPTPPATSDIQPLECEKYGFPPGTGKPGWPNSGVESGVESGVQSEFSDDDRGPGSNWPNLPGWKGNIVNLTDDTVSIVVERSAQIKGLTISF